MGGTWTFGRKIAAGFALSWLMLLLIGAIAYRSTGMLIDTGQKLNHTEAVLQRLSLLISSMKDVETAARGYVIVGEDSFLDPYREGRSSVPRLLREIRQLTANNPAHQRRIAQVESFVNAKMGFMQRAVEVRRKEGFEAAVAVVRSGEGNRIMEDLRGVLGEMERDERDLLARRTAAAQAGARDTKRGIVGGALLALALVSLTGVILTRSLTRQIGSAVAHVESASAQLQSAANQQALGSREQATAMSEITTTISELIATSRQIAESAKRVAQIAGETAGAAGGGDDTVQRAQEAADGIKRQVDQVVGHMLDLGRKSQRIGGILEIITELAEQTNILAINATIEAAGAGEAGRRFAVVAEEIRKLADRVSGSTGEIRDLIEEIRASVNTTVMATEGSAKAADAGMRQFAEVTASFKRIGGLVGTTTEATREIELSTQQQTTAVEQVEVAINDVAQATKEMEVNSNQTLQTASQLASLSRDLARLIQPAQAG